MFALTMQIDYISIDNLRHHKHCQIDKLLASLCGIWETQCGETSKGTPKLVLHATPRAIARIAI